MRPQQGKEFDAYLRAASVDSSNWIKFGSNKWRIIFKSTPSTWLTEPKNRQTKLIAEINW